MLVELEDCPAFWSTVEVLEETPGWLVVAGGFEVVLGFVVAAPAVPAVPVVEELVLFTSVEVEVLDGFVDVLLGVVVLCGIDELLEELVLLCGVAFGSVVVVDGVCVCVVDGL